jgi:group I intron endonuclease
MRRTWETAPKHPGIYAIRHVESGRMYIGSAKNIYDRWREHRSALRRGVHHSPYLQNAWNKYGEAAFVFEVLEHCLGDAVMLCNQEQHWLDRNRKRLFNARRFADPNFGTPQTPELKAAASERMMGNNRGAGSYYCGKLTEADVIDVLKRYASGESCDAIASGHGIHSMHVSRIASRRIWSHVRVSPEVDGACLDRIKSRARGFRNHKTKLGEDVAKQIKERLARGEIGSHIARELGVNPTAISAIKHGRNYKYIQ